MKEHETQPGSHERQTWVSMRLTPLGNLGAVMLGMHGSIADGKGFKTK